MQPPHQTRQGSRYSFRRYESLYPSIEKEPALHVPFAYGFADGANVSKLQTIGRRQEPFYALVTYPAAKRAYIRSLISPVEAEAVIRKARAAQNDAEWEADAPTPLTGYSSKSPAPLSDAASYSVFACPRQPRATVIMVYSLLRC